MGIQNPPPGRDLNLLNSKVQKRYLLIGGVLGLIVVALIVGAVRPSKQAMGAQPSTPDVEVAQVQKEDAPIYGDWHA